jgi:hypothetical protein
MWGRRGETWNGGKSARRSDSFHACALPRLPLRITRPRSRRKPQPPRLRGSSGSEAVRSHAEFISQSRTMETLIHSRHAPLSRLIMPEWYGRRLM